MPIRVAISTAMFVCPQMFSHTSYLLLSKADSTIANPFLCLPPFSCSFSGTFLTPLPYAQAFLPSSTGTIMACCTTPPCAFHPTCYDIALLTPPTCAICPSNSLATDWYAALGTSPKSPASNKQSGFSYYATRLFPSGTTQLICDVSPGITSILFTPLSSPLSPSHNYPASTSTSSPVKISAGGAVGVALGVTALMLILWRLLMMWTTWDGESDQESGGQ
jgi:hypothetical protein